MRAWLAAAWHVVRYAFGPARHADRLVSWWPVFASLSAAAAAWVLARVTDLELPWLFAGVLLIAVALVLRAAVHFYREAHPAFPPHMVSFENPHVFERPDASEPRVLLVGVSFTNRGESPVRLTFSLLWQREVQGQVMGPYECRRITRGLGSLDVLSGPLDLDPKKGRELLAAFDVSGAVVLHTDEHGDAVLRDGALYIEIEDYVSGATERYPLEVRPLFAPLRANVQASD